MSSCDLPQFYSEKLVKARRPHVCCETKRVIQPGEMYWRCNMKFDGRLDSFVQSVAAYHFARWLNWESDWLREDDGCVPFTEIGQFVSDWQDPELTAEWERVKRGEVTRDTTPETVAK